MTKKLLAKYHQIEIVDVLNSIIRAIIRELEQETLGNRRIFRCAKCRFKRALLFRGKMLRTFKERNGFASIRYRSSKGKKSKAELRSKSFDLTNEVRQGFIYHAQNLVIFSFQALWVVL